MARLVWFALGAAAGVAYASSLVHKERLDLAPGVEEQPKIEPEQPKVSFKQKMADTIDLQADRIANKIDEAVLAFTDKLHVQGHTIAAKLRGQTAEVPTIGVVGIGTVTMYEEPFIDEAFDEADTGLEANR